MSERHIDVDASYDDDDRFDLPEEWGDARTIVAHRFHSLDESARSQGRELARLHNDMQNMRETLHHMMHQIQQANAIIAERLHKMEFGLVFCGLAGIVGLLMLVMITTKLYH